MRTCLACILAAVIWAAIGLAGSSSRAWSVESPQGEFSIRPQRPESSAGRDRFYIVAEVAPGARLTDRIELLNLTDQPLELDIEPVDAGITDDGAFAPAAGGVREEVGSWIDVARRRVTVPPRSTQAVDISIRVPEDARPGDHVGAIVAAKSKPDVQGNVRVIDRVGLRVYLTVTGDRALTRAFSIMDFVWDGTRQAPSFSAVIRNNGDLLVEPAARITVGRIDGPTAIEGQFPVLGTIPPGEERTFALPLQGELAGGTYLANLVAFTLQEDAQATATVEFDSDKVNSTDAPSASLPWYRDPGALIPIALSLLILALALVLLVWFLAKRRRRDEDDEPPAEAVPASSVEAG